MKRKIVYAAAAWGAGLALASFLPPAYDFIIIPAALLLLPLMKFLFRFRIREIVTVLSVFAVAAGVYRCYDIFCYRDIAELSGEEVTFSGKILEMNEYSGDKTSYLAKGKINGETQVKMTVYADAYNCRINDYLTFTGTVKTFENSYLFNSLDYNKSRGVFLTSDKITSFEISENNEFSLTRTLSSFREQVTDFVIRNLPEEESAMLCAMLFGDKSGLSSDDKTMFYRTGIGHVMAVSGLHLVLFCGIFSFIFKKLRLGKIKSFVLLECIMILFAVCSGLSQSVIRAALMLTLVYAAPLFFRKADTLNSIGAAFIILTVSCPFMIRNPSLILSVCGTFSAGVFAPYMTEKLKEDTFLQRRLKNAVYMFFVSLGVFPASVIFFGESSLLSPIANIFLTPLCMAALLPALIASLVIFLNPVFLIKLSGIICKLVMVCVRFTGRLKFSGMNFGTEMKIAAGAAVIICIVVYLTLRSRKWELVSAAACTASAIVYLTAESIFSGGVEIALMGDNGVDVMVISDGDDAQVIDISGHKNNCRYAVKYLQENNIDHVNGIIIKSNPYQAMSVYNSGMGLTDADEVILASDVHVRDDTEICGNTPVFSDFSNLEINVGETVININDTRISAEYGDFEFVCDSSCNDSKTDVYAEYDNIFDPPLCSVVIVPEYENICNDENVVTDRNVLVKADKSGSFSLGGL
ncbi:MAG: ComEC/Rec2 family competence protein [Porcipelethomonas sp.]